MENCTVKVITSPQISPALTGGRPRSANYSDTNAITWHYQLPETRPRHVLGMISVTLRLRDVTCHEDVMSDMRRNYRK